MQDNKDILGAGYEGDVFGESTPDVIVSEFVCFFLSNFLVSLVFVSHMLKRSYTIKALFYVVHL